MKHATTLELTYDHRPSALPYMVRAVIPVRRRIDLSPPISAHWRRHRADPHDLAAFERITGLANHRHTPTPTTLPLLYPHTFGFRLAMAILTHPRFPVPIWGVLQTRNHLVQHRPIAAGAALDFETRVLPGRVVPKGAEFDLHTTVHVDGTLAWESVLTFFSRGRFGAPDAPSPQTRSPADFGSRVAEWRMADTDHVRFGRFTGDYNGIHLWDWYARRMGFPRALYHPQRVLGQCLARLRDLALPDRSVEAPLRLDTWIKGPVPHDASVRLHVATTTAPATSTFALFAEDDERPAIVGRLHAKEFSP